MIAISRASSPSAVSIITIRAVLSAEFPEDRGSGTAPDPAATALEWSDDYLAPANDAPLPVLDVLIMRMSGAGHSVAALAFYLGLAEAEVRDRVKALDLPEAQEKPLRRSGSANPWSVVEVRSLIALWLDNVSAGSIAGSLGRSAASVHRKRRWLGLDPRDRKQVKDRPAAQCRVIALPWKPKVDVSKIVEWLTTPGLGRAPAPTPLKVQWVLGRDAEKDSRFSTLGFAGLTADTIAARMMIEFGVFLSVSAVNTRLGRLQIMRDRWSLISEFDEETVQRRAGEQKRKVGAVLRQCVELHRSFWWYKANRGSRFVCREFETSKRYASRRAERSYGDITAMAA